MLTLIDNGHGRQTRGKRSPDGSVEEWRVNRQLAHRLLTLLQQAGEPAALLVPEDDDIPIGTRRRRIMQHAARLGAPDVRLISIHCNAAADGRHWSTARGWSVYLHTNAKPADIRLATQLAQAVRQARFSIRRPGPAHPYWTAPLALLRDLPLAACLTENLFMDNRDDCLMLQQPHVLDRLAEALANGLLGEAQPRPTL